LLGYVFFLEDGESGTIVDLFAIDDPGVKLDLISAAVAAMRKNPRLASVSLSFLSSHPQRALFLKRGFFARESHPVIVAGPLAETATDNQVFLMDGDRDS